MAVEDKPAGLSADDLALVKADADTTDVGDDTAAAADKGADKSTDKAATDKTDAGDADKAAATDKATDKASGKKDATSIVEDAEGEDEAETAEDKASTKEWRDRLFERLTAGLEEKLTAKDLKKRKDAIKNELKRYKSEDDYMIAGYSARQKLATGEYKLAKLPENATDEEIKKYREDQGVPEKASDYQIPAVPGHKWTEEDKPGLSAFAERMHKISAPQAFVAEAATWYKETVEAAKEAQAEAVIALDKEDKKAIEDTLRAELGAGHYRPAVQLLGRLLKDPEVFPDGSGEYFHESRGPDGRRVINNLPIAKLLMDMANDRYADTLPEGGDAQTQMSSRKAEIEKIMNTDLERYRREDLGVELRDILAKEERSGRRGRAA